MMDILVSPQLYMFGYIIPTSKIATNRRLGVKTVQNARNKNCSRGGNQQHSCCSPDEVSLKALNLFVLDLRLWLQRGVATDVDPVVVEGRAEQVCDILRVVWPPSLGGEVVRVHIKECEDGSDYDEGGKEMLERLDPCSFVSVSDPNAFHWSCTRFIT